MLNDIKSEIINLIRQSGNEHWVSAVITIDFPPFINKGYSGSQIVKDENGNNIRLIKFSESLSEKIFSYIVDCNQDCNYNQIVFTANKNDLEKSEIKAIFSQEVDKNFQDNLLESQRGKYLPWWKQTEESPELSQQQPEPLQKLPKPGVQLDTSDLTLGKAFVQLNKVVTYKDDPLWDGGYYSILHNEGKWIGGAILYLYESRESKEKNWPAQEVTHDLEVTEEIKTLFLFIQEEYKKINPQTPFDSIFVTVQRDGVRYVTNFELHGNEVYPDAPPMPEVMDAGYLCLNLKNCLVYNAPDNYEWIWEVISRIKTEDGRNGISGEFYYSLHKDKSDPQKLEPGEYIYMYNVTSDLFDNYLEGTTGWRKVALYFNNAGRVLYKVIESR